jgi:formyl-CoA transferase
MDPGVERKDKSVMKLVGQPVTLSRTPSKLVQRPPAIGEHTDSVLKEFGFKPKDIAVLRKANAI